MTLGAATLARGADISESLRNRLSSGVIRWGGDAEGGAPYQFRDSKDPDRLVGFEVDLADALAYVVSKRLGTPIRFEFKQYEWDTLPLGLERKDFDIVISGFETTAQNQARFAFTRPYYLYAQQLAVRKDESAIASLDDCKGKRVGTLAGSAAAKLLEERGIETRSYSGQTEPYLDLELGRLDAVLLDWPIAVYYAAPNPNLKLVGERIARGAYGIALRKEDRELAALLDDALAELVRDGRLAEILLKWRIWNADQYQLAQGPERGAELAGLLDAEKRSAASSAVAAPDVATTSRQHWTLRQCAAILGQAALVTIGLSVVSMAVAVTLGLVIAIARLGGPAPIRLLALLYVEFFRGVPLLLLLLFFYFGLPQLGIEISAIQTAVLAFGLNYAAYEAEIQRSAIQSVPRGQWEAGLALGMSPATTFRRIVLPQAVRTALGPTTNDFVAMFKDTSLVSVIAVVELTKQYYILAKSSNMYIELGLLTAVMYLAMSVPLGYLSRWLETRWGAAR
jgi:polar amino acid transport system substrate-binding protein